MDLGIQHRIALILGGTRGLGFSCAKFLHASGARVILNGRDPDQGEAATQQLPGSSFIAGDIGQEAARDKLTRNIARIGPPDIIVTNAGGPPAGPFEDSDIKAWRECYETNVLGPLEIVRAFLPSMKSKGFGRIINITSFVVKELYPNMALSNSLRVGLTGAMGSLAKEVAPFGITINNILPGLMDTGALKRVITNRAKREGISEDEVKLNMANSVPMQRLGTVDDFGFACVFLSSKHAAYITGQNICIDGGLTKSVI